MLEKFNHTLGHTYYGIYGDDESKIRMGLDYIIDSQFGVHIEIDWCDFQIIGTKISMSEFIFM